MWGLTKVFVSLQYAVTVISSEINDMSRDLQQAPALEADESPEFLR